MMKLFSTALAILIIAQCLQAQVGYTKMSLKLPNAAAFGEYYVKPSGDYFLMNGDIIVSKKASGQKQVMAQRPVEEGWSYIWPKGYIPIDMEDSITSMGFENAVIGAIEQLSRLTRLRFKPRTNEKDYIFINFMTVGEMGFSGGNSWVGRQGGRQDLNLSSASESLVMHELLHAAGFYHEQSRPDRDNYIEILWNNIQPDSRFNYQLEPSVATGEYNYTSIMHYYPTSFGINGKTTMRCKSGNTISDCKMGGNWINQKDITDINAAYFFNQSVEALDFSKLWHALRTNKLIKGNSAKLNNQPSTGNNGDVINQQLEEGRYKIKVNQTGKYLAVEGISKDNGARLVQWDYVDQANHQFYVRKIADGIYVISAVHSGKYINAAGQGVADGTPVIQWDYAAQDNVRWKLYYKSGNQGAASGWVIQNIHSGTNLSLPSFGSTNNGEALVIRKQGYNDGAPEAVQTFSFEKIGNLPFREQGLYENSPGMLKK
jgi:hypothetical protein